MRLMDMLRERFGRTHTAPSMTDEQRAVLAEQRRIVDRLRLARIDAGIRGDRRRVYLPTHPHRRQEDKP